MSKLTDKFQEQILLILSFLNVDIEIKLSNLY
jgi:hypothetical protein